MGCFDTEEQRKEYLDIIKGKIEEYYAGLSEEEYHQKLEKCWGNFAGMEPIDL